MHAAGNENDAPRQVRVTAGLRAVARDAAPMTATGPTCSCGHGRTAHEHYRRGRDCALCGCARYRRPWLFRRG